MFCIKSRSPAYLIFIRAFVFLLFTFLSCDSSSLSKGFVEIPKLSFRTSYNFNCCSIFKDHSAASPIRFVDSLYIIPLLLPLVNTFFIKNLNFYKICVSLCLIRIFHRQNLLHCRPSSSFSKEKKERSELTSAPVCRNQL